MDEMNISSKFMTNIVSRMIERFIFNKFGKDIYVELNNASITCDPDGNVEMCVNTKLRIDKENMTSILKHKNIC